MLLDGLKSREYKRKDTERNHTNMYYIYCQKYFIISPLTSFFLQKDTSCEAYSISTLNTH